MFSVLTHNSNGSNGSNTTVTPESVAKAKQQSLKPAASRKTAATRPSKKKGVRAAPTMPSVEERPNVFEFMVEDEEEGGNAVELDGIQATQSLRIRTASVSSNSSAERTCYTRPKSIQDDQHHCWSERSFPSGSSFTDSGISVRSSSPERDSSIMRHKLLNLPPDNGKRKKVEDSRSNNYIDGYATSPRVLGAFDGSPGTSPEAFYSISSRPSFQGQEFDISIGHLPSHRSNGVADELQDEDPTTSEDSIGFGRDRNRLASHISLNRAAALKPIYRKFESLNNRALLHLQGEISELEIQLENVDRACVDTSKATESGLESPDVGSDILRRLRWQRSELMCQILTNLERYSELNLRSCHNLLNLDRQRLIIIQSPIQARRCCIREGYLCLHRPA